MATFYGQLAAHELGNDAPPRPVPEPAAGLGRARRFRPRRMVRARAILFAAGDRDTQQGLPAANGRDGQDPADFAMLADLAEKYGRIDLAIAVSKRAIAAGMPLMIHGYPVTALPSGGNTERRCSSRSCARRAPSNRTR